jgi:predicted ATPase
MVEPVAKPLVQVPLQDTGEGLIQVLPVLVAAARLRSTGHRLPRILAVEEPESHLHPRLHAALTEHFCRWASLPDPPQIVIETHSENILLRVQIAIAEGTLSRDLVAVYWIRQDPEGRSRAELVKFDLQGRPLENWPPGVFHENLDQARKLLAARRDRQV